MVDKPLIWPFFGGGGGYEEGRLTSHNNIAGIWKGAMNGAVGVSCILYDRERSTELLIVSLP